MKRVLSLVAATLLIESLFFSCSSGDSSDSSGDSPNGDSGTWMPGTNTPYTVEHYQENADDDGYSLIEVDNLTGMTDGLTAAEARFYEHFVQTSWNQEAIAADGSTVIRIYYVRETIDITLDLAGGWLDGYEGMVTKTGKYGQTLAIGTPTRKGYTFEGWTDSWGNGIPSTYYEYATYTARWSVSMGIDIVVDDSDITVIKTENGNYITFTADECDTYRWLLDETEISTAQSCMIDTDLLEKGTYTLSLEAQKGGRWYSYFAQITVNK